MDDPAAGGGPGKLDSNSLLAIRDAGIKPGASRTVKAGKTVKVRFKFVYAGSTGVGRFTFSASTSVPGGSADPSVRKFKPTSSRSKRVKVTVNVPKNTKPGKYTVKLTARLADGEFRTATVTLHVRRHS